VQGYGLVEPTHLAVAAAVASGQADAGIGIHAAAAQFGLDFIPLLTEQYYFACLKDTLKEPAMVKLLDLLTRSDWHTVVRDLPGYDPADAGRVVSLRQALPWYAFRAPKGPSG
jgi:putative molybdopterin biosynthesis protein